MLEVNEDGLINFFQLDRIKVEGKTLPDLEDAVVKEIVEIGARPHLICSLNISEVNISWFHSKHKLLWSGMYRLQYTQSRFWQGSHLKVEAKCTFGQIDKYRHKVLI